MRPGAARTHTFWQGRERSFIDYDPVSDRLLGEFHIDPDYSKERIAILAPTVAETYVPVNISVGYAGQSGTPKPFLMIIEWVRVPSGAWKMATDIALPIPPPPNEQCAAGPHP